MAKKLSYIITADNNPAIKALSDMGIAISKIGSAFKAINASQKAAIKIGKGGALDPKDLNAASEALKDVSDNFKSLGINQKQYERGDGFKNLQNGFRGTTRAAREFHSAVTDLLRPLMALTGIGSVGAVVAMADRYAQGAREIQKTSYLTGASTPSVQRLVNRGRMYGMSADETTGAFQNISSSIEDAVQGRNYPLLAFLQRQEFGLGDISQAYNAPNGPMNITNRILSTLQKNYKNPRERAGLLAGTPFGAFTPTLMYGDKEANRRNSMADRFGAMGDNSAINRLESSMNGLSLATETLQRNMTLLVAKFSPIIDALSGYISSTNGAKDATSLLASIIGLGLVAAFDLLAVAVKRNPIAMAIWAAVTAIDVLYNHWSDFVNAFKTDMAFITGDKSWISKSDPITPMSKEQRLMGAIMSSPMITAPNIQSLFGGNTSNGISISGNAPKETVVTIVHQNVPRGTKVSTTQGSTKVVNHINYSSFGLAYQQ